MAEMPPPRKHHRQPVLVGGGNDVRIFHRAARLNDGGRAGDATASRPSRNGKNASDAATLLFGDPGAAFITATLTASTRLICPAPTASVR